LSLFAYLSVSLPVAVCRSATGKQPDSPEENYSEAEEKYFESTENYSESTEKASFSLPSKHPKNTSKM
jgi:hypothetical protein